MPTPGTAITHCQRSTYGIGRCRYTALPFDHPHDVFLDLLQVAIVWRVLVRKR